MTTTIVARISWVLTSYSELSIVPEVVGHIERAVESETGRAIVVLPRQRQVWHQPRDRLEQPTCAD